MFSGLKRIIYKGFIYLERLACRQQLRKCHVKGHDILLETRSEIERYRASTYNTKEPETLEWVERYVRPGDVVYDVGANIGLYSLFAAKHLNGQGKVYAFEPEALNFAQLSKNIHLNGLSGWVIPCCVAITDTLCFDMFYLNPNGIEGWNRGQGLISGSALHSFGVAEDFSRQPFQPFHQQGAVGVSLDYLWQAWGFDFPNHIKIDVDGLEGKVIAGATQTLADKRLKSILIEISARKKEQDPIWQALTQQGFTPVTDFSAHSSELLIGTPYEDSVNCVFIRDTT